jgi:hypothetical protein
MYPEALNVFRDAYTVEFLGLPQRHAEADLHRALLEKLKEFLIELGGDFCFVGSQYPFQVGDRDFALDLLFFHRGLNCLVAFELLCGAPHKRSNKISVQPDMVEEQIDVEDLLVHGHRHLTPDEGEAAAQLQEEVAQLGQQPPFDLPLPGRGRHGQKIKVVGVLEDLLRHVRVRGRQRTREVGERLPFPLMQTALDLQDQDIRAPGRIRGRREGTTLAWDGP